MKLKQIYSVIALMLIAGCSGGPNGGQSVSTQAANCSNSVMLGSWVGSVNRQRDTITITADCSYADSLCQGTGTFPDVTSNSGTVLVTVTSTNNGPYCLPVGQTACAYSISGNTLTYSCGGEILTFSRQ